MATPTPLLHPPPKSLDVVKKDSAKIIADVAPAKKAEATKILADLNQGLIELKCALAKLIP